MKLAIVGSRNFTDYKKFCVEINKIVKQWGEIELIISGGAPGVDTLAERYAKENNLEFKLYPADWNKYKKAAGPKRNTQIVNACTHMIALPSENSIGTKDSIKKAQKANKILEIVYV